MESISSNNYNNLPFNIEAEKSLLGGLLLDPNRVGTIQSIVNEHDFYLAKHKTIFNAMERVFDKDATLDIVTLANTLDAYSELETIGGHDYLLELLDSAPTSVNTDTYANIVREKAILRKLIFAADKIRNSAMEEGDELESIIDQSERLILSVGEGHQNDQPVLIRSLISDAFEKVEKASREQKDVVGLATGYADLDRLTTGFQPDQLIIIAARPSVGKTAFALNIAQNVATKSKIPVVIFSLEMGALDLVNRIICAEGNINATNLRTGQLTDDEWSSFTVATNVLSDAPIYIDDTAGIKVSEIRAKCRRLKQEEPNLGLIVIDYLQLIDGSGRSENRQQEVSEISRQLKKLAKELGVPVIALSQLSRGVEHRQNKRPLLADIRESGSIEQDADIVAFLYREDYHQHDPEEKEDFSDMPNNTVEIIIAKNRSGALDTVKLLFKKEYNKFSSLAPQYYNQMQMG